MKKDATETKSTKAVPGQGHIELELGGEKVYLKPSLHACIQISRLHRSTPATVNRVSELDFDTITEIVALGLGVKKDRALQQKIYDTGVTTVAGPVIKFITVVNHGGRLLSDEDEVSDEDQSDEGNEEEKAL